VRLSLREHRGDSAVLELSTDPARHPGQVELKALELEPDEGVILRLI
jgi:hypothetical protein